VKATVQPETQGIKRAAEFFSDVQSEAPVKTARRRKAKKPVDEEEDGEGGPTTSSQAPVPSFDRSKAKEPKAKPSDRHQTAGTGPIRGGSELFEHAAENSSAGEDGSKAVVSQPSSDPSHDSTPTLSPLDGIISVLSCGDSLPMVHSSKIDFSPSYPVVVTRTSRPSAPVNAALDLDHDLNMFATPQAEGEGESAAILYRGAQDVESVNISISQASRIYSLAGQVCRVLFRDETSDRHVLADVILRTPATCESCCDGEPSPVAAMGKLNTRRYVWRMSSSWKDVSGVTCQSAC